MLKRDASVLVLVILICLYPLAEGIHSDTSRSLQLLPTKKMTINNGREYIASAREMNRYLLIRKEEILISISIVTCYGTDRGEDPLPALP